MMKQFIRFFALWIPLSLNYAQGIAYVDVGDKLIYDVESGSDTYTFTVKILHYDFLNKIVFSYEVSPPFNKKGMITLSSAALDSATSYQNYFTGGEEVLTNRSAVFMSSINFNQISQYGGSTYMDMLDGNKGIWKSQWDNYSFIFHGESVSMTAYYAQLENNGPFRQMVVSQLGPQAVIVKLDLGFKLWLRAIEK